MKIKMNETTSHPSVSFFDLPVALQFKNSTQQKTIVVDNNINGETFLQNIGFRPDTVIIDPEYWLITKNNSSQKVSDAVSGQNNILVYPNPILTQFYVYLRNFSDPSATVSLYNMAGQMVYSQKIVFVNGSEFIVVPSAKLSSGIYTLRLLTSGGTQVTKKLVK